MQWTALLECSGILRYWQAQAVGLTWCVSAQIMPMRTTYGFRLNWKKFQPFTTESLRNMGETSYPLAHLSTEGRSLWPLCVWRLTRFVSSIEMWVPGEHGSCCLVSHGTQRQSNDEYLEMNQWQTLVNVSSAHDQELPKPSTFSYVAVRTIFLKLKYNQDPSLLKALQWLLGLPWW